MSQIRQRSETRYLYTCGAMSRGIKSGTVVARAVVGVGLGANTHGFRYSVVGVQET